MSIYQRWAELSDREAVGDTLTDDERAFLREHAGSDALAGAESDFWDSMRQWPELSDPEGDRALAERAVRIAAGAHGERTASAFGGKSSRVGIWLAAGLAAAAGVALYAKRPQPVDAVATGPRATIEYVASSVRVSGAAAERGARVAPGTEVEAVGGAVCVALEASMHACLPAGARVRLSQFGNAVRQVELVSGRVAVALSPLPPGERFSVVAGGATSTAVGTAYTVELTAAGARTVVHEGKVAVSQGQHTEAITAHRIGLAKPDGLVVEALTDHAATETEDWIALAKVAGRSVEAPWETAKAGSAAPETPDPAAPVAAKGGSRRTAPRVTTPVDTSPVPAESAAAQTPEPAPSAAPATPTGLFAAARQALREQRWNDAAAAYRDLATSFPGSAEARTALVPLAKLELDRLGQPQAALGHLEAYLAGGGSLVVEAKLTKIRAYRALGRSADEARSIDEFLADHPNSLDAPALRTRRVALPTR